MPGYGFAMDPPEDPDDDPPVTPAVDAPAGNDGEALGRAVAAEFMRRLEAGRIDLESVTVEGPRHDIASKCAQTYYTLPCEGGLEVVVRCGSGHDVVKQFGVTLRAGDEVLGSGFSNETDVVGRFASALDQAMRQVRAQRRVQARGALGLD